MDLNKKIKEQDILLESINKGIDNIITEDNLLTENWFAAGVRLLSKLGVAKLPKPVAIYGDISRAKSLLTKSSDDEVDKTKEEIKDKESELTSTEDEAQRQKIQDDIDKLNEKLDKIAETLKNIESESKNASETTIKKVDITFREEYKLDIQKLKSPEFKRTLKGKMYFDVLLVNESSKYIEMITKSFPDNIKIRLYYKTLKTGDKQKGKAQLVYNDYSSTKHNLKGDFVTVEFEFFNIEEK